GPLISLEPVEKPIRSIFFHRSLIATRGPVLEFPGRSQPLVVRSLGSTFAKVEGGPASTLFSCKLALANDPRSVLDWAGEDNAFVGWSSFLASGSEASIRVAGVDKIRATWPS